MVSYQHINDQLYEVDNINYNFNQFIIDHFYETINNNKYQVIDIMLSAY